MCESRAQARFSAGLKGKVIIVTSNEPVEIFQHQGLGSNPMNKNDVIWGTLSLNG